MPALPTPYAAGAFAFVWTLFWTVLQWSVVRFELGIVVVLTGAAVLLATALIRRWRIEAPTPRLTAAALVASALVAELVPSFSYTTASAHRWLTHGVALTCLVTAVALVLPSSRRRAVALAVAVLGMVGTSSAAIRLDRAPRIDVWVILQQASDGLARGENMYQMVWVNSPGIKDAFTYLPWTAVLLAPGRWLLGDVRWALLAFFVAGLLFTVAIGARGRGGTPAAALSAATLLALAPGTLTQMEQGWTEPLLFALLAAWALLVRRGHPWWAVLPLALGCASKQHLALLLPVLACWAPFGWRRTLATGGLAGVLILPWFIASPSALIHDTITLLIGFHPIKFANTLFIAAQTELGWTPPFWLTGLIALGTLAASCAMVWRRQPPLHELLGWLALVLLVANLVNKQAFYNQYWLVGALAALSLAAVPRAEVQRQRA